MTSDELRELQAVKQARDGLSHAALKAAGILMAGFVGAAVVYCCAYVALGGNPKRSVSFVARQAQRKIKKGPPRRTF